MLEVSDADRHYTERLVRLSTLGTYYHRPHNFESKKTRRDFGFDESMHLYVCPQTLFKFHPEFDPILAEILRRDPAGNLVLIEGRTANWTRLLKERFTRVMSDCVERIRWLSPLRNQDFLQLLALADVVLDPIHFGGGNTSYEALAAGVPIVTFPGSYLRSRITRALYAKIGVTDALGTTLRAPIDRLLVESAEGYIDSAVRIAGERELNEQLRQAIVAKAKCLFEDETEVDELARWMTSAIEVEA